MRVLPLFALLLALAVSPAAASDTTYGTGVTLDTATPIETVIADPGAFAGRTIRVEGVVTAVCAHMGCWMTLAPAGTPDAATLRLKVDDGVVVFPVSAKGRQAVAQGVVEPVGGGDHEAAPSPAGARAASYQLKVTGAVIR
jgi:hypothetical protein